MMFGRIIVSAQELSHSQHLSRLLVPCLHDLYQQDLLQHVIDIPDDSSAALLQQCVYDCWGGSSDLPQLVDQVE